MVACRVALEQKNRPSLVLLSRQNLPILNREKYGLASMLRKGGYIISDSDNPDIVIFSSGSEVSLSIEVKELLKGHSVRIINMACWELFEEQTKEYKKEVLSHGNAVLVSIEAGITTGWQKYTGRFGLNIGIDCYGESAPGKDVAKYFGLTVKKIVRRIKSFIR